MPSALAPAYGGNGACVVAQFKSRPVAAVMTAGHAFPLVIFDLLHGRWWPKRALHTLSAPELLWAK